MTGDPTSTHDAYHQAYYEAFMSSPVQLRRDRSEGAGMTTAERLWLEGYVEGWLRGYAEGVIQSLNAIFAKSAELEQR